MDELNGVSARFQSHSDVADFGCWDCYAGAVASWSHYVKKKFR